ncbi:MAG: DUF6502 family protein [Bdellovibrionota bacterium]|nr:MAG: DUF6502 family protein [Bdellovibrionota bacterium]
MAQSGVEFLGLLLRPIIRYCIRHSHTIQDVMSVAKQVFVEVAHDEIQQHTEKINISRLSIMTGIHRKELKDIFEERKGRPSDSKNILWRVIGQWEGDRRFASSSGKPRTLTYRGSNNQFRKLVESVCSHTDAGTILFELERAGCVERTDRGLKLVRREARTRSDVRKGFLLLSEDIDTMITAVEQNVNEANRTSNLHIRTHYDSIFVDSVQKIRQWLVDEGKEFHRRARKYIAKFDSDINPEKRRERAVGGWVTLTSVSCTSAVERVERARSGTTTIKRG